MPGIEDGGQYLTCRAENQELPTSVMEDTLKLDVQCKLRAAQNFSAPRETRRRQLFFEWASVFLDSTDFFFSFADVPIVSLELGSKLQLGSIKEGDDVYMECNIRAHPWITKVTWKHNVKCKF